MGIRCIRYKERCLCQAGRLEDEPKRPSSDWVRSTKATTGILSAVKPAIATGAAGAKYISYLDNNSGSSIFYTSDMSAGRVASYCGVTDPLGSYHDIEFLSTTGKAMIAHMETTSGNVGNIVTELDKTSTSWFKRPVVSILISVITAGMALTRILIFSTMALIWRWWWPVLTIMISALPPKR